MAIEAWRKAIAEFIGAFTLIFIGAGSIISLGGGDLLLVAFAHGLAIGVMVSAGDPSSSELSRRRSGSS